MSRPGSHTAHPGGANGVVKLARVESSVLAPPPPPPLPPSSSNSHGSTTVDNERALAALLAELLHVDRVPVDSHFFDHLGADSLVMAHFCAKVRKRGDLPSISIRDVYKHPTIRHLATAVAQSPIRLVQRPTPAPVELPVPASRWEYVSCAVLQLAAFLAYTWLVVSGAGLAYDWMSTSLNALELYTRLVLCGLVAFVTVCAVPILAKWVLIGRWRPGQIRLWSLGYVRFWVVKTLIRSNPCALLFVGTPLYVLYLRALGARIGPGVAIFSRRIPVCTDLLVVGAGTVIRKESFFQCYRATVGRIEMGPVTLGRDVVLCERTILDIHTEMGDGSQLGHASSLQSGQAIPAGERWHGSPAQRTSVDYHRVAPMPASALRQVGFCVGTLLMVLLVYVPTVEGLPYLIGALAPSVGDLLRHGSTGLSLASAGVLAVGALQLSAILFFGGALCTLILILTVPRILNAFIVPDRVYPLYGFHDRAQRAIARITNIKFFKRLFGDSSFIVHYLSALGYKLEPLVQTGSNFGTELSHGNPFLCTIGTGTMVADGLAQLNDEVSTTAFWVSRTTVGAHNFVGNDVVYPVSARTGENCLLGSKTMIPLHGQVHENTGLLGSPCFEIPRTVDRDVRFDHLRSGPTFKKLLAAKTRYNLATIGIFLFSRWLGVCVVLFFTLVAFALYDVAAHLATVGVLALSLLVAPVYHSLAERTLTGFRPMRPTYCSIYDPFFWLVERVWKVPAIDFLHSFDGTVYKNFIWRLMGVRIGKRVFDDGIHLSDRSYVTIGDGCAFNTGSCIQCHSQEDGTFKSDYTRLGANCTLGVGALVHYGVTMGEGASLAADSFLMKGEQVPEHARWGGNPARES